MNGFLEVLLFSALMIAFGVAFIDTLEPFDWYSEDDDHKDPPIYF